MLTSKSGTDKNYRNHPIFKELDVYEKFYEDLIYTISSVGLHGVDPHISFNGDVLTNIKGTLHSLRLLLDAKLLNDGNALLRKFYEISNFHIYLLLYISHETKKSFDNGSAEIFVAKVKKWIESNARFGGFADQMEYIKTSSELSEAFGLLDYDNRYSSIKKRANGHIHLNSWRNSFLNNCDQDFVGREEVLEIFSADLADIIILHITLLFIFEPFYMCSENYLEFAEMNQPMPVELENKAMPFVDKFFIDAVLPRRKDIFEFVEKCTGIAFES